MPVSMLPRRTLVLATSNRGKIAEFRALLAKFTLLASDEFPFELRSVAEVAGKAIEVEEDGATFEQNAIKKATTVANALGLAALADDSGLEVDALMGRPGVRSARYAGQGATDAENNVKLLSELDGHSDSRYARFRCVIALHDPFTSQTFVSHGTMEGAIAMASSGHGGFGYDPVFLVANDPKGRTLAELDEAEKNAISHRSQAFAGLVRELMK